MLFLFLKLSHLSHALSMLFLLFMDRTAIRFPFFFFFFLNSGAIVLLLLQYRKMHITYKHPFLCFQYYFQFLSTPTHLLKSIFRYIESIFKLICHTFCRFLLHGPNSWISAFLTSPMCNSYVGMSLLPTTMHSISIGQSFLLVFINYLDSQFLQLSYSICCYYSIICMTYVNKVTSADN